MNITFIHIHYVDIRGKDRLKSIRPTDQSSTLELKLDIVQFIERIKPEIEYYYVVFECRDKGKKIYRNVCRKVFPNGESR
jgi:hypothetical protein